MSHLNWISDKALNTIVVKLIEIARNARIQSQKEFGKNVIDPFSAIFEISGFDLTYKEWIINEETRQAQKTLQNFIGNFHQEILGSCKNWKNLTTGNIFDLHSSKNNIVAEVKNKYNTLSGGKLSELYKSMESAVMNKTSIYKKHTAYYVVIIPKTNKRYDIVFTPSDKEQGRKCPPNQLIREIDGASFYEKVTGDQNALKDLYAVLPGIISSYTKKGIPEAKKLSNLFSKAFG